METLGTFPHVDMITTQTAEYLSRIFSDADLLDVDFSHWDSVVSVYVSADHVESHDSGGRTLIAVRFRGVRNFNWEFRHHDFDQFPLERDQENHLEWNIYRSEVIRCDLSQITVSGSPQFPIMTIHFQAVDIEMVERSVFSRVNPRWCKPGSGLARPGIEQLYHLQKKRRGGKKT